MVVLEVMGVLVLMMALLLPRMVPAMIVAKPVDYSAL